MGLHYYHIMLDFCEMNSVLRVFFRVLLFIFFGQFLSVAKYFLDRSEILSSADPCLPYGRSFGHLLPLVSASRNRKSSCFKV